jgi:hypothetical protein
MRSIKHRFMSIKKIALYVLLICLNLVSVSCDSSQSKIGSWFSDRLESSAPSIVQPANAQNRLAETAPPKIIRQLEKSLALSAPKVTILEPQSDRTYQDTDIKVQLKIDNFQIFQDERWKIGPSLQLIIDDRPNKPIYNLDEPIFLEDLSPGTHTIRVFATRPWQESFKNPEAYAQSTFHVITPTHNNSPSADSPLLTYNSPTGNYTAEPLLLDFYLANAPAHDDKIPDWRVRVTINGETFVLEDWQSVYLKGFKPGKNWVHLELIDDRGNIIENVYNDTVRWIEYNPQAKELDTLGKLVSDRLSINEIGSIVDPDYRSEPEVNDNKFDMVPETPEVITPVPETTEPNVIPLESLEEKVTPQTEPSVNEIEIPSKITTENEEVPQTEIPSEITTENAEVSQTEPLVSRETNTIPQIEPSASETEETIAIKTETPAKIAENIGESETLAKSEIETNPDVVSESPELKETEISPKQQLQVPEWLKNGWQKIHQQVDRLPESIEKLKAGILELKANILKG